MADGGRFFSCNVANNNQFGNGDEGVMVDTSGAGDDGIEQSIVLGNVCDHNDTNGNDVNGLEVAGGNGNDLLVIGNVNLTHGGYGLVVDSIDTPVVLGNVTLKNGCVHRLGANRQHREYVT